MPSPDHPELLCALITLPPDQAPTLARAMVEARLAACVQQLPVQSTYRWEGDVESGEEVLLLCKTSSAHWPALRDWVAARHPYAVPQLTCVPLVGTASPWAHWLLQSLEPNPT